MKRLIAMTAFAAAFALCANRSANASYTVPEFDWTSEDAPWTVQDDGSWRSGELSASNTYSEASVYLVGPAQVSFEWKVSSANDDGLLYYEVDDYEYEIVHYDEISGNTDWEKVTFAITGNVETELHFGYADEVANKNYGWVRNLQVVTFDIEDGVLYGISWRGDMPSALTIPEGVESIESEAFAGLAGLRSVYIPASVTYIGEYAFADCENLSDVYFAGDDVFDEYDIDIEKNAFEGTPWLDGYSGDVTFDIEDGVVYGFSWNGIKPSTLTIPEGVTNIAAYAFEDCSGITTVNLPSTLKSIGKSAFEWCDLETVNGLTDAVQIGPRAFASTPFNATLPFGLDIVDNNLFGFRGICPATVAVPNGVTNIAESAFDADYYTHDALCKLSEVIIPASVEKIDTYAFWYCKALRQVEIGTGVATIGKWAFEDCTNLVSVTIKNPGILIDGSAFSGCEKLELDIAKVGYKLVGWDLFREKNPHRWVDEWDDDDNYIGGHYEEYEDTIVPTGTVVRVDSIELLVYGMPTGEFRTNTVWNSEMEEYEIESIVAVTNYLYGVWATPAWERATLWKPVASGDGEAAEGDDAFTGAAAATYDGYLYGDDGLIVGTMLIKAAKSKNGMSKITATIQTADGKKQKISGTMTVADSKFEAGGLSLAIGANGVSGKFGDYYADGAQNKFTSKDKDEKAAAAAVLKTWQSAYSVAWESAEGWNGLSLTVAAKGKVKIAGTLANGVKVSAKSQLLIGEDGVCAIPVLVTKKASLAFNVWLTDEGIEVAGLDGAVAGKATTALGAGSALRFDADALAAALGDATYVAYMPTNIAVAQSGTKWSVAGGAKAGKVQLVKGATDATKVDEAKAGANPSALKFTYKAKDGTFKGSFKAYTLVKGKPKAVKVNLVGVVVDGAACGTLFVKKPAVRLPFTIE